MLSRPQIQPYAQFLMGAGAIVVTATLAVRAPSRIDAHYIAGLALIGAACVAMAIVWHYRPTRGTVWIWVVPFAAILACVPIRAAAVDVLPAAGLLVVFPLAWLAFAFPIPVVLLGVTASLLLPAVGMARRGAVPATAGEWMSLFAVPVLLALFAVSVRFVAIDLRDQRERTRQAQSRLAEALRSSHRSSAALRQLLETTPGAVAVFDAAGDVLLVNAPAAQMSARAGLAMSIEQRQPGFVFEDDRVTPIVLRPNLRSDILAGRLAEPRRVWVGPPGEQIAARFLARSIVLDDEVIGMLVVADDITELVEAVEVRDRFLDTVGHELRTPLTVILGNTDLALATAPPPERERWEAIQRSAERLEDTVELILATGRAHVATPGARTEALGVVQSVVAEARGIRSDVDVDVDGESVEVAMTRRDVQAIVRELVRNAVQVSPAGSRVSVGLRPEGSVAVLSVADHGPGLTAAERRQVFHRFYRTAASRSQALQGLGLGLSLVQSLASAYGTTVDLEPRADAVGGGTVARVRMPLVGPQHGDGLL